MGKRKKPKPAPLTTEQADALQEYIWEIRNLVDDGVASVGLVELEPVRADVDACDPPTEHGVDAGVDVVLSRLGCEERRPSGAG